jgi:hypothetical protein
MQFPDQTIPETNKDEKWCRLHIDYARELYESRSNVLKNIQKNFESYTGSVNNKKIKYLTDKYGNAVKGEFKTFKLGKNKVDLLAGEFLLQPLKQQVSTTNKEAVSKKMQLATMMKGAIAAKKEIEFLRKDLGMNILEGMEIPEQDDPNLEEKINPKTKNEIIMNKLLSDYVKKENLKDELYKAIMDVIIAGECFGKNEILADGKAIFRRIDPRYAIYEEIESDTFLGMTPIIGEHRPMTVHQILTNYWGDLGEENRKKIKELSKNPGNVSSYSTPHVKYDERGNITTMNVTTIEWFSVRPHYVKISPNSKNPDDPYKKDIEAEDYEKNYEKYKKDIDKGKYKIETTYTTDLWEATMIGDNIMTRCRRKPYQYRNQNKIGETKYSYTGLLFNNHAGNRVSIQEMLDNISFLYDVAWYQITKELSKYKGTVFVYDLGALPSGKNLLKILNEVTNDGILTVNSAADQNRGQRDIDVSGIKTLDLGLSSGFSALFNLLATLEQAANNITGLNENRQGNIAASSTATNANSAIRASRTISEPMFYFFRRFTEEIMLKLASDLKLSLVFFDDDRGENIVGDSAMEFLRITKDFAFDDYGVYISDGGKEVELKDRLMALAEVALNAKELRFQDLIKLSMAESLSESYEIVEKGFEEVQKIREKMQQMQGEQDAQTKQMIQQMHMEEREDAQAHERDMLILKHRLEVEGATEEIKAKSISDIEKMRNEASLENNS